MNARRSSIARDLLTWTIRAIVARLAALLIGVTLAGMAGDVAGQEPISPGEAGYRQIFVPADRPDAWPTEGQTFLPMDRAEFFRLIAKPARSEASVARIESIELNASLNSQGRLVGRGRLTLVTGEEPYFFAWPNRSLKIQNARWTASPEQPALLGAWVDNEGGAKYGLAAPQSGELTFDFQALPQSDSGSRFQLPLPAALRRTLTLKLPSDVRPITHSALVRRLDSPAASKDELTQRAGTTTWHIRPRPNDPLVFDLPAQSPSNEDSHSRFSVSESLRVDLAREGANVAATFVLRSEKELPATIRISAPLSLVFREVKAGGEAAAWRVEPVDGNEQRLIVELPNRMSLRSANIDVTAWGPDPLDQVWQMPTFEVEGAFWEEGSARVEVANELRVADIPRMDGVAFWSNGEPSTEPQATERYRFCYLRNSPSLQFAVVAHSPQTRMGMETLTRLNDAELWSETTITIDNRATAGDAPSEVLEFVADIGDEWLVETVDAVSGGQIDHWYLQETPAGQGRQLIVQRRSLSFGSPDDKASPGAAPPSEPDDFATQREAKIKINCRRGLPATSRLPIGAASPLAPLEADLRNNILTVSAEGQYALKITERPELGSAGSQPHSHDDDDDRRRSEDFFRSTERTEQSIVVDLLSEDGIRLREMASVELREQPTSFSAETAIRATAKEEGFLYRATIRISGLGATSELVRFRFQPPLPAEPRWSDLSSNTPLGAERTSAVDAEVWKVRLPVHAEGPQEVTVETIIPQSRRCRLPLISLVDAESQKGHIVVAGQGIAHRQIDRVGITARHAADHEALAYEYNPNSWRSNRQSAQLTIGPSTADDEQTLPNQPLRLASLETIWTGAGVALHAARYEAGVGLDRLELGLPREADLIAVTDAFGRRLPVTLLEAKSIAGKGNRFVVAGLSPSVQDDGADDRVETLVGWKSFTVVMREYVEPADRIVKPTLPLIAAQRSTWRWTLRTPKQWRDAVEDGAGDWRKRLLGPLAQAEDDQPFNPLTLSDWLELFNVNQPPEIELDAVAARMSEPTDEQTAGLNQLAGWATHEFLGSQTSPPPVKLIDITRRRLELVMLQLGVMALSVSWLVRRPSSLLNCLAASLVLALVAPDPLAPWASAIWFGMLLSLPLAWVLRGCLAKRPANVALPVQSSLELQTSAPLILFSLLTLGATCAATAEEVHLQAIEPVLIPINDAGEPVGDKWYVRQGYLKRLLDQSNRRDRVGPTSVIIERARQSGKLLQDRPGAPIRVGRWSLDLHLWTLRRDTQVRLPLDRDAADWPATASIDGVPTPLHWDEQGGCWFVASEPGRSIASISFEPKVFVIDGESSIRVVALPTPANELAISHPESLDSLRVPFARKQETPKPGATLAVLEASEGAFVSWLESSGPDLTTRPTVDVFQWLHVDSDEVTVEVLIRGVGSPGGLRVVTPAGWENNGMPTDATIDARSKTVANDKEFATQTRFRMQRQSPHGRLRAPTLQVDGATIRRQLAAISIEQSLRRANADSPTSAPLTAEEFVSQWAPDDESITPPDSAAVLDPQGEWILAVEPNLAERQTPSQSLELTVGAKQARCQLSIEANDDFAPVVVLDTPPDLEVESIAFRTGQTDSSPRWTRPTPKRLVVFVGSESAAGDRLTVVGSMNWRGEAFSLPKLALADRDDQTVEVTLMREEGVLVEQEGQSLSSTSQPVVERGGNRSGRIQRWPVVVSDINYANETPRFRFKPNHPDYDATVATIFRREQSSIVARWEADVRVTSGLLGALPVQLSHPTTMEVQLLSPAGANLRRLNPRDENWLVELPTPITAGESVRINLQFSMPYESAGSLAASLAELPAADQVRRFLAKPATHAEVLSRPLRWNVSGMGGAIRLASDAAERKMLPTGPDWEIYATEANAANRPTPGRVTWTTAAIDKEEPSSPLVEHQLVTPSGAEAVLTTRLALNPGGAEQLLIHTDAASDLRSVTIDGAAASAKQESDGWWKLDLISSQRPQLIQTVVVAGDPNSNLSLTQFSTIQSLPLASESTIWAIHTRNDQFVPLLPSSRMIERGAVSVAWLRALERMVTEADSSSAAWIRSWRPQIQSAVDHVRSYNSELKQLETYRSADSAEPLDASDWDAAEITVGRESQDLSTWAVLQRAEAWLERFPSAEPAFVPASPTFDSDQQLQNSRWTYFIANDPQVAAMPEVYSQGSRSLAIRWLLACGVMAVVIGYRRRIDQMDLPALAYEFRHALVAIGGLAWWLLLEPSFVGLLLLTASVVGQIRWLLQTSAAE